MLGSQLKLDNGGFSCRDADVGADVDADVDADVG